MKKILLVLVTLVVTLTPLSSCTLIKASKTANEPQYIEEETSLVEDLELISIDEVPQESIDVVETVSNKQENYEKSSFEDVITLSKEDSSLIIASTDSSAPVIFVKDIFTEYNVEPIFDSIIAIDELDGRLVCSILGSYDIKKAGIYPMSVIAIDRAANVTREYFNLIVNEHPKQQELNEAEKDLISKKQLLDEALMKLEEAKNELIIRNNVLASNENNLANLNNKLNDLSDKKIQVEERIQNANKSLSKAIETYSEVKENYNNKTVNLQEDIDLIKETLNNLNNNKNDALNRLNNAYNTLSNRTNSYNDSFEAYETIKENLKEEKDNLDSYNNEHFEAVLKRDLAQQSYDEALSYVQSLQKQYDDAVYRASQSEEFKSAKKDLEDATNFLSQAKQTQTEAINTLATAAIILDEATQAKNSANTVLENAKSNLEIADKKLEEAKAVVEKAQKDLENARGISKDAQEKYDNAIKTIEESEIRKANAEKQLEIANMAYEKADENLENAQRSVDNALARYEAAQATIASGSLGFFKSRDNESAQFAVEVIEKRIATQDNDDLGNTNLGQKGDATSLENMSKVFNLIREGNALRTSDEYWKATNDLLVNDVMMAIAQIQTNASAIVDIKHSGLIHTAENLAWGYSVVTGKNGPYQGWYHEEKLVWEVMNNKGENADGKTHTYADAVKILKDKGYRITCCGVGHYTNLVNPFSDVTGLAYNSVSHVLEGGYPNAIGQVFLDDYTNSNVVVNVLGDRWWGSELTSDTYTVDEYEEMFKAYVKSINKELEDAQQALIDARKELSQLQTNGGISLEELLAVVNAQTELDSANGAIFIYTNEKDEAEAEIAEYQAIIDEKQKALDVANDALAEKLVAHEEAVEANDEAQSNLDEKVLAEQKAKEDKNQAELDLELAIKNLEDAENDVGDKQEVLNSFDEDINEAYSKLIDANKQAESSKEELDNTQTTVDDLKILVDSQNELVDSLTKQLEDEALNLENKQEEIDLINEEINQINEQLDGIDSDIDDSSSKLQEVENILDTLKQEVISAQNEVDEFENTIKKLEEEIVNLNNEEIKTLSEIDSTKITIDDNKEDIVDQEAIVENADEEFKVAKDEYDKALKVKEDIEEQIDKDNG